MKHNLIDAAAAAGTEHGGCGGGNVTAVLCKF